MTKIGEKMTNADRIRKMTDEGLADSFTKGCDGMIPDESKKCGTIGGCFKCWLDWLKEEAEDATD